MRGFKSIGLLLLANFVVVVILKSAHGNARELLWISHFGLFLAALGFLLESGLLIATCFVSVFILHALWLFDAAAGLTTGDFPLGATRYLQTAPLWLWVSTAHHFYLLPLLAFGLWRRRECPPEALVAAIALFLYASVASRFFLDPADNVNFAFGLEVQVLPDFIAWANRQRSGFYLVGLNAFATWFMFLPAYVLARLASSKLSPGFASGTAAR
jgi:hypothetical protein